MSKGSDTILYSLVTGFVALIIWIVFAGLVLTVLDVD